MPQSAPKSELMSSVKLRKQIVKGRGYYYLVTYISSKIVDGKKIVKRQNFKYVSFEEVIKALEL